MRYLIKLISNKFYLFWSVKLEDLYLDARIKIINLSFKREKNQTKKFHLNQKRYEFIIKKLKNKTARGRKIRVCFFVVYDFSWAYRPIYEEMLKDELFDPFIVVIPDTSRGKENLEFYFNQAFVSLSKKYRNVRKGYSDETGDFFDFSEKTDLVCFPNSYKYMSNYRFEIEHFLNKNVLTFYVHYSFSVTKWFRERLRDEVCNYFWKIFSPTVAHLEEYKKYQLIKGDNVVVSGYAKMDGLAKEKEKTIKYKRKMIIIAPHHTVVDWKFLQISNFLQYSDLFLKLPEMYPEVDFVFRPHPLLKVQLSKPEIWGEQKTAAYFEKMSSFDNVIYSEGGEYFSLFANSDGMIHDCGSFLAEYLFTEKPACYLLKDRQAIKKWFIKIGEECIEHCYQAYSEKNIIDFIDNVIISEKDDLKESRLNFVNSNLKVNYPIVAKKIIETLRQNLVIK